MNVHLQLNGSFPPSSNNDFFKYFPAKLATIEPALVLPVKITSLILESGIICFSLFKFDTIEEAIALSNDSEFGLGASIFTKDLKVAHRIADQIDAGMVFINSSTISDSRLPYGGVKNSGYGRSSSYTAIEEFTTNKLVGERLQI